jgi:hypothetical protein
MNPDQVLFIMCAGFEISKILIPALIIGYITLKLN